VFAHWNGSGSLDFKTVCPENVDKCRIGKISYMSCRSQLLAEGISIPGIPARYFGPDGLQSEKDKNPVEK
jgi:hypothetical protein